MKKGHLNFFLHRSNSPKPVRFSRSVFSLKNSKLMRRKSPDTLLSHFPLGSILIDINVD